MTTNRHMLRIARRTAFALLAVTGIALAGSSAQAGERHGGYGHGHAYGHRTVVYASPRCAAPIVVARPGYWVRPAVVVRPAPFVVPVVAPVPIVRAYPVAAPYGSVVYDPVYGHVGGFIGFSGPHVSFGIGF